MILSSILALLQSEAAGAAAEAGEETTKTGGGVMQIMWIVIIVLFVWLFLIKPMRDQKKRQAQLNKLEKGTKVITTSGIYGTIKDVEEKAFVIEIAPNVKITVSKDAVYPVTDDQKK